MPLMVRVPDDLRDELFPPTPAAVAPEPVPPTTWQQEEYPGHKAFIAADIRDQRRAANQDAKAKREWLKTVSSKEAQGWQEPHSSTTAVQVVLSHGDGRTRRTTEKCRRRKPDARLWDRLTAEQEWAATYIMEGWRICGGTLGCRTMAFAPRSPSYEPDIIPQNVLEREGAVARVFQEWVRAGRRHDIHAMSVIDYLAGGHTLSELDARQRVRKGTTSDMIVQALDFYCEVAKRLRLSR